MPLTLRPARPRLSTPLSPASPGTRSEAPIFWPTALPSSDFRKTDQITLAVFYSFPVFEPPIYSRTLTFSIAQRDIVVSPVPLPPALPMFATALLKLAIVGYARRTKGVIAAQP